MYQLLGEHTGKEFELGQFETKEAGLAAKRHEERNGYYTNLDLRDYDEYARNEYAKLPQNELERLAGVGDAVAREVMAAQAEAKLAREQEQARLVQGQKEIREQTFVRAASPPPFGGDE